MRPCMSFLICGCLWWVQLSRTSPRAGRGFAMHPSGQSSAHLIVPCPRRCRSSPSCWLLEGLARARMLDCSSSSTWAYSTHHHTTRMWMYENSMYGRWAWTTNRVRFWSATWLCDTDTARVFGFVQIKGYFTLNSRNPVGRCVCSRESFLSDESGNLSYIFLDSGAEKQWVPSGLFGRWVDTMKTQIQWEVQVCLFWNVMMPLTMEQGAHTSWWAENAVG